MYRCSSGSDKKYKCAESVGAIGPVFAFGYTKRDSCCDDAGIFTKYVMGLYGF